MDINDITDQESLETWLNNLSDDDCKSFAPQLAYRCALRCCVFTTDVIENHADLTLAVFRALALAGVFSNVPARAIESAWHATDSIASSAAWYTVNFAVESANNSTTGSTWSTNSSAAKSSDWCVKCVAWYSAKSPSQIACPNAFATTLSVIRYDIRYYDNHHDKSSFSFDNIRLWHDSDIPDILQKKT